MEIYIEFLTTQAKTLSFLAFVGKTYQVISRGVLQLACKNVFV
jgi:hypothetical protein